jgi:hypothetical protein
MRAGIFQVGEFDIEGNLFNVILQMREGPN